MNSIARVGLATGVGLLASFYPQLSAAEGFTGAEFSAWDPSNQDSYIETSITMAGVVLAQLRPDQARCVNDWYFKEEAWRALNPDIRDTIATYSDAHPSGVILALLVRECGALDGP